MSAELARLVDKIFKPTPPCLDSRDQTFSPTSCIIHCYAVSLEDVQEGPWKKKKITSLRPDLCKDKRKKGRCPCEKL